MRLRHYFWVEVEYGNAQSLLEEMAQACKRLVEESEARAAATAVACGTAGEEGEGSDPGFEAPSQEEAQIAIDFYGDEVL